MARIHAIATRTGPLLAALLLTAPVRADPGFDPKIARHAEVVEILTQDEGGEVRNTRVWVVLVEGQAYLRTNDSRWLGNLRRDPDAQLRVENVLYAVRAEILDDPAWVDKVDAATREKYGWQERAIHVFRMRPPQIVRLLPRSPS